MTSPPVRTIARAALVLVATAVACWLAWPLIQHTLDHDGHRLIDLEVYRTAGREVLDGDPVYDFRTGRGLPFTYPPVAAWLAVPLALVPWGPAGALWTLLQVGVLAAVVVRIWRPVWARFGSLVGPALVPLLVGGLVWIFPARDNVVLGQVNFVLLALVLLDLLPRRTWWPRGALVGVATAVKLTPGLFVPYLWLSGRRRAAYTAAATFGLLVLVTWLVFPEDSSRYWFREMWNPHRIGNNHFTANQSIRGFVLHLGWDGAFGAVALVSAAVAVLAVVLVRAPRLDRAGDRVAALAVVGLGTNLLSPVTWVHHTVWFFLAIAVLVDDWRKPWRALCGAGLVAVLAWKTIYLGSGWARTADNLASEVVGRVFQNSFAIAALLLVAFLPARERLASAAERVDGGDDGDEREQSAGDPAYGGHRQPV